MTDLNAKQEAVRVTLVGMWLDLLLGIAKIIGGSVTGSFALIADGIHSLTDVISDWFVILVSRISYDAPDDEHPYGHGRFETMGTIVMGMLFFAIAAVLLYESYRRLANPESIVVPALGGLVIAGISIASKEWIYHYTMRTAIRLNSSLLSANAWHSRTDAISSIAVLFGIAGAYQGYPWVDVLAAAFVAVIIARIGWRLCLDSLVELVDTAISKQEIEEIRKTIHKVKGIRRITNIRSRKSGGKVLLEVQIQVDSRISVSEGHHIGEAVSSTIENRFHNITDVMVHIDAESHTDSGSANLPSRENIVGQITQIWQKVSPQNSIQNIDLHYLHNSIEVDIYLNKPDLDPSTLKKLQQSIYNISSISRLKIFSDIVENNIGADLS